MTASGKEPPPDVRVVERMARQITDICMDHCDAWGHGAKPSAEAIAALAFAFATITYTEREDGPILQAMTNWWSKHVTLWWRSLERLEASQEAEDRAEPG